MAITAITSVQEFDEKVLGAKGLAIVDFWAGWCEPCTVMRPEIEDKNLRGILLKEDVDGIPSLVFFRDGKMLDSLVGYKKADMLESLIKEVI